jgi:hypothetical protein
MDFTNPIPDLAGHQVALLFSLCSCLPYYMVLVNSGAIFKMDAPWASFYLYIQSIIIRKTYCSHVSVFGFLFSAANLL